MQIHPANLILKKSFRRLQQQNPAFSLRAAAKKIGVSHAFLSRLLNGKADLPAKRLRAIAKALQLDGLAFAELKAAVSARVLGEAAPRYKKRSLGRKRSIVEAYAEQPNTKFTAIENWYELPILDLLTCENSITTPAGIAKRLGIKESLAAAALQRLKTAGFIREEGGILRKADRYIRFPTKIPMFVTKNYYRQVFNRASAELEKSAQADFERRSMQNLCIAVNPEKLDYAKERLLKFAYELSLELSEGEAKEVYFLATLLFPVTKSP